MVGKEECMLECVCANRNDTVGDIPDLTDYTDRGYNPKGKFNALPRRKSTYRLAKNLDAVSRKAMLYYESSEMYNDGSQQKKRGKKNKVCSTSKFFVTKSMGL